jgi:8-oxo-dGTP pyrophosphatase MutT (NUDIX family)
MGVDPQKFFIGVVDFLSVILPGAALAYLGRNRGKSFLGVEQSLGNAEQWCLLLFASYLLGHLIFLFGALLDAPYDWLRSCTLHGQQRRLADGKHLRPKEVRWLARVLFKRNPDAALLHVLRLKARSLAALAANDAMNAFQWCKARLAKTSRGTRDRATTRGRLQFFRSFAVLLLITILKYRTKPEYIIGGSILLVVTLWRYLDQRFKATQQAYWTIIASESAKPHQHPLSTDTFARDPFTHAGGVVYRSINGRTEYLLVEARKEKALVLPKGHIEPEETPRDAAVREVHEETGTHARIIDHLNDERLGADGPLVRFFLMEAEPESRMLHAEARQANPEDRQTYWRNYQAALDDTKQFRETTDLLTKAQQCLHRNHLHQEQVSTASTTTPA